MNDVECGGFEDLDRQIQEVEAQLQATKARGEALGSEAEVEAWEQEVTGLAQQFGDLLVARRLQETLCSPAHREREEALRRQLPRRYRWEGWREVTVQMTQGTPVRLWVRYASRSGSRRRHRERGLYPGLLLLGLYEHCTPGRASKVAQLVVAMGSLEEAERHLREQGQAVERKRMRRVTRRMAQRARLAQQVEAVPLGESVAGRRVVVAMDGGRLRVRHPKRGRRTAKGRHRYHTPWKEPKLLIVYTLDAKGRQDKSFSPWIDGTLRGPDVLFTWLTGYLQGLHITQADRVQFIADGAAWIWNRIQALVQSLGLRAEQVVQTVDFYHAVEHLALVAKEPVWSEAQRRQWLQDQVRHLRQGRVGWVLDAIDRLRRGRGRNSVLRREREYFSSHRERLRYAQFKAWHLPLGSGAIESAIRRVVNLRLKGASLFWNEDTAEEMLMLRAFYKAGRWNLLKRWAFSPAYALTA